MVAGVGRIVGRSRRPIQAALRVLQCFKKKLIRLIGIARIALRHLEQAWVDGGHRLLVITQRV
jgi:hypothetical protein